MGHWLNKMMYSHDRILYRIGMERTIPTYNNMDKLQNNFEWKKPDTINTVQFFYVKFKNRPN